MKLKKEIATLLLASTLLTASLTACQQTPDGGNKINNTTPEITVENTTPEITAENTTPPETTPQNPPSEAPSSPFDEYQRHDLKESFINGQVGYTFVFDGACFVALFKTTDGGETWDQQTVDKAPDNRWNENVSCAKMLDENIGCIFVAHRADDCLSSRTHITTDGGKTWTQVILPPDGPYVTKPDSNEFITYAASTAACDFFYEDGKYIICFEKKQDAYIHFQYSSTDLKNWTFEKTFDVSVAELEEALGCYISNECGNNLEVAMENDNAPFPIRFEYEEYESTEFKIITKQGDTEFCTTVPLPASSGYSTWDYLEPYTSFQNELSGYVFIFNSDGPSISAGPAIELTCLLKTTDGGKTWEIIEYQNPPLLSHREYVQGAHFFTDQVGFFTGRYTYDEHVYRRTYWTTDGGKTWQRMSAIKYPNISAALGKAFSHASEVADIEIVDGIYIMTVRLRNGSIYTFDGGSSLYIKYSSSDLKNWTLVPSNKNNLDSKQNVHTIECNSSYSPYYNEAPAKVLCKYEYEDGGKVYLQIDSWNQTVLLPFTYTDIKGLAFSSAATIYGDKGIFVYSPDGLGTSIKILSFTKGSDEITEQTITWDEAICQNEIFCDFIDDENGYVFVIEEGGHPDFASGYQRVSKLYKTQDGGKTWTSIDCSNAPYTNLRECMILAKFATEDIGIIAGRHWASDYSFHKRTYITKDGGKTWTSIDIGEINDSFYGLQAYDLQYIDGTYYLYINSYYPNFILTSTDGVEWKFFKSIN